MGFGAIGMLFFVEKPEVSWDDITCGAKKGCNSAVQAVVTDRRAKAAEAQFLSEKDTLSYKMRQPREYHDKVFIWSVVPHTWCRNTFVDHLEKW